MYITTYIVLKEISIQHLHKFIQLIYSLIKLILCRGDAILFDMSTIKIITFNVIMMTAAFDTLIHCCTAYFYIALFPKVIVL